MNPLRRTLIGALTLSVLAGGATAALADSPSGSADGVHAGPVNEQAQLQKLYKQALADGGTLTVYAGGDTPYQADYLRDAFLKKFPKIKFNMVTDLSKYHDARIDNQIATGRVVADVAQLQTLDDFPYWKKEGALAKYKPVGWDKVYSQIKDKDGYYTGVMFFGFANVTATTLGSDAPVEAKDFLKPEFKNKLVFTYPNDDDAVLFYFKQLTDKYGLGYLKKLLAQHPKFVRGTQAAADTVGTDGYVANFGSAGSYSGLSTTSIPKTSPWVTWPQTAAILKKAPHKAAAELYLSWLLSKDAQTNSIGTWSARTDVPVPAGRKGIFDYKNTNPLALGRFMGNRTALARYKALITLYVGDVKGVDPSDPNGVLGLYPINRDGTQG
ncbi:ABC transporter substrate-binding protein [Streptomyces hokutonensis]|uniref:ABC transporter substrate-binding protein n=1 Tax=Streptomyces hokutonensis TaxID=1306990 RepID=UPI00037DB8A2|nr:extracellular solute-binding protein [Streptomyces hokutonensis]